MTKEALETLANLATPDAGASDRNKLAVLADIALSLRRIAAAREDGQTEGGQEAATH